MKRVFICSLFGVLCVTASVSYSREVTVSGGLSLGYDLFDREYEGNVESADDSTVNTTPNDDDYERIIISPSIKIISSSSRNSVELEYAPGLWHDLTESENDIDHKLEMAARHAFTRQWNVRFSDLYVNTDEYNTYATPEGTFEIEPEERRSVPDSDSLRDESGRRRYYKNDLNISTDYTYLEDSLFSLGYSWNVLRNEETSSSTYEDYDKHNFFASLGHQLTSRWRLEGYGRYIRGLYDSTDNVDPQQVDTIGNLVDSADGDLTEYHAGVTALAEFIQHHPLSLGYNFAMTDYDAADIDTSEIHDLRLGYTWKSTPRLEISFGAGPTYSKRVDGEDDWSGNGNLDILYRIEHGTLRFSATGGTEFENFSGTQERGFTEYWQTRADFSYNLLSNVLLSAYGYYRDEDKDELSSEIRDIEIADINTQTDGPVEEKPELFSSVSRQQYAFGCSAEYTFMRGYRASIAYGFVHQDSDKNEDNYEDHRLQLTVSYSNDFFKW